MKKRSGKLSRALIGVIIFIIVLTLALVWVINSSFLEGFYLADKERSITEVFHSFEMHASDGSLYSSDFSEEIADISARENISCIVISPDGSIRMSSRRDVQGIVNRLFSAVFTPDDSGAKVSEDGKYTIKGFKDPVTDAEYLTLWGVLPDGNTIFIESAMAAIRDSVALTNRFLIIAGIVSVAIGLVIAFVLTSRILKPLRQLTDISERMGYMEFDAKFVPSKSHNEIDILGIRMNEMSDIIENNIKELRQANVELRRDIKRREENELMRREFISNVSHELKTPISLILGYAEGLDEGTASSEEDRRYYTSVIVDEAERMDSLIRRLMELNELEYGLDQVEMKRVDLAALIQEAVYAQMMMAKSAGVTIRQELSGVCNVWTDEFLARRIIENYLTNAIRYAEGEQIVRIGIDESEGDRFRLYVFNTCDGIPDEEGKRIWDKFYKTDPARTREKGGTGLGLSIVKAAADSLGGEYGYRNTEGGVEFFFTFDMAKIRVELKDQEC